MKYAVASTLVLALSIAAGIALTRRISAGKEYSPLKRILITAAVSMTLINIGELAKNITQDLKDEHREIPWRAIAGMRDVTAHKYQTLRKEDVYSTCAQDLPTLEKQILKLLSE